MGKGRGRRSPNVAPKTKGVIYGMSPVASPSGIGGFQAKAASPMPIWGIAGQSNAEGVADTETCATPLYSSISLQLPYTPVTYLELANGNPTDPLTWFWSRGPTALSPKPGGNQGFMGPELSLGRHLTMRGITHGLVKCAVGSTNLFNHWKASNSTFPSSGPSLFQTAMNLALQAEMQFPGKLMGWVWVQGESDAQNGAATLYQANLIDWITQMRKIWPNAWFVFNQLPASDNYPFEANVVAAQQFVAKNIPYTRLINSEGLEMQAASPEHFTGTGYYGLGARFADAIYSIMTSDSL